MLSVEQSLRDDELPAAVKEKWVELGVEPQFQLRLRASGIIRIQHRLDGDQEVSGSFTGSCTAVMCACMYGPTDIQESHCDPSHDNM